MMNTTTRRGTLPIGHPPASSIPSYMTQTHSSSANDSIGSNDSFKSQVPLPFHMAEENEYPPPNHVPNQHGADHSKSASPAHQKGSSTGHDYPSSSATMLNPNSRPYVPAGNSPLMSHAFESQLPPSMGNGYGHGHNLASNATYQQQYGYGYGHGHNGGMPSLPPNQYGATNDIVSGFQATKPASQLGNGCGSAPSNTNPGYQTSNPPVQFGGGYGNGNPPDPYGHFGVPASMNSHSDYHTAHPSMNHQGQSSVYQPAYSVYPTSFSTSGSPVSPVQGYETMTSSQTSFQSMPYSSGSGSGVPSSAYSAGQGFGQGYADPYLPAQQNTYNNDRYQSNLATSSYNFGTTLAERSRAGYGNGNGVNKNDYDGKRINFANQNNQNNQHSLNYGNGHSNTSINQNSRPQSRLEPGGQEMRSPQNENQGALMRYSSPESVSEKINNINKNSTAPTADPKIQTADLEFSSETRKTPQLRSRRGQTITSTDPSRKENNLATWLDNVPSGNPEGVRDTTNRARSPTKPPVFALAAVNESDPFSTPIRKLFNNPFAPAPTPLTTLRAANMNRSQIDGTSAHYKRLTNNGTRIPSIEEALDFGNLPFAEYCRWERPGPDNYGVIKIRNIPYSVNRQEIMAFLGRNARLIQEFEHEPIHIVMERVTSKTLDCYVEFVNLNEAVNAVNRFETNKNGGRGGRLGQRHVDIELSSQDQLMKDLFPKAKNVRWHGGRPEIIPVDPNDPYNSGFKGFVSKEELIMLVKHVEAPQRSPFSKDCPQRPFECLISTLLKYPWYMVEHITIEDRNLLHDATKSLLSMLALHVSQNREDTRLTGALLKRAWRAVLACPGFTPTMKDDIAVICDIDMGFALELGLAPQAAEWRYLWTIGPKKGAANDVLMFYIGLIRDITIQQKQRLSLAEQAAQGGGASSNEYKLFGDLDMMIQYPPGLAYCTLDQVAKAEWLAIETALRRALTPALQ